MSQDLRDILGRLERGDYITDLDVIALRGAVFGDGDVSVGEADSLFRINNSTKTKTAHWPDFFMEAISEFVVRQTLPYGYVDTSNATWLIARISKDGHVETMTELRVLINVLKIARDSTDQLAKFALEQVKNAVLYGSGVVGRGRTLKLGVIGETEVSLLKAVLYASGGENSIGVSRNEADIIFDINDAVRGADNHPSWSVLFRQAVSSHLMLLSASPGPDRDAALSRDMFLSQRGEFKGNFANVTIRNAFSLVKEDQTGRSADSFDVEDMLSEDELHAEIVSEEEAQWLKSRIGRDGQFDDNERALLTWIKQECPQIHHSLNPLLRVA